MITKQQKFIEDNDIVGNSATEKSKSNLPLILKCILILFYIDLELFLDDGND